MVRNYKRKTGASPKYSDEAMLNAIMDVDKGVSQRMAAKKYGVSQTTLRRRYHGIVKSPGKIGRKTALLRNEEFAIANNLASLGDFGLALDSQELRTFIKYYLDMCGRHIPEFKDNLPGLDWVHGFLKRHENLLSSRICQNISRKRAAVTEQEVAAYFDRLENSLRGVPPQNIINYDETNITDDPKGKLQIFRRGIKHAERIMNTTKSSTSIMFAITASGMNLSPYVVYKAERLQQSWIEGGPVDVVYNRTSSGWFDSDCFVDWFKKVAVNYFRRLPAAERKVIIGDNLASHINPKVAELCEQYNTRMVFLPANSTHFLQPLDVAVFSSLKSQWRNILTNWKLHDGKHMTALPKWMIPKLLLKLEEAMVDKWEPLAKAGFRACGIHPLNPQHVISKMRREPVSPQQGPEHVSPNLLSYLKERREGSVTHRTGGRGRQLKVLPGQSVSLRDLKDIVSAGPSGAGTGSSKTSKKKQVKRRLQYATDVAVRDSEEDDEEIIMNEEPATDDMEEVDDEIVEDGRKEEEVAQEEPNSDKNSLVNTEKLDIGSFVLVKFEAAAQNVYHYLAKLQSKISNSVFEVSFMRRKLDSKMFAFVFPENVEIKYIDVTQIVDVWKVKDIRRGSYIFHFNPNDARIIR